MKKININNGPSYKDLKVFAYGLSVFIFLIFIVIPYIIDKPLKIWPIFVIITILVTLFLFSKLLVPLYNFWMKFGRILGYINTRLLLFIIYIFMFFPYRIILIILRKDPMNRRFYKKHETYKIKCYEDENNIKDRISRPF
tara:strand:- start:775 stop:1194 length:420 start_codon:yes stop_codon:yes gene_type:complete